MLQIGALFILMAVGFLLGRRGILDAPSVKGLSTMIVKATLPALILMSLQKPFSPELLALSLKTLAVAVVFYCSMSLISLGAVRLLGVSGPRRGTLAFSLGFSNAAFIGFPVITSILGLDALFQASIHNIPFNLMAFSVGVLIVTGGSGVAGGGTGGRPRIPLKNILNLNVFASFVGFGLFVFSVKLPAAVAVPLDMLGGLTTPLAMIATGAMLARTPLRSVVGDWRLYAVTTLRLAVWPLLVALALKACGITGMIYDITVIVAAMPAASNTSLIAEVYGGDTDSASSIIFLTTLLSVLTIPVVALLLR
jgi:malate permease and related proteins